MDSRKKLIASCLTGGFLSLVLYLVSPARVAVHFNQNGIPNSWASREVNFMVWLMVYGFIGVFFTAIPGIIKQAPRKFVNLPHRDFWLAPERFENSCRIISGMLYDMGAALSFFFMLLEGAGFQSGLKPGGILNKGFMDIMFFLFCAYTFIWLGRFLWIFGRAGISKNNNRI